MAFAEFPMIDGLRNRELTQDQYDLVTAIKDRMDTTLYLAFQEYWMKHCDNSHELSAFDSWRVLSECADEMFDRSDRYYMRKNIENCFWHKKALSATDMCICILGAIELMQMRYDEVSK